MRVEDKGVVMRLCLVVFIFVVVVASISYAGPAKDVLKTGQQQYKFVKGDVIAYDVNVFDEDDEKIALLLVVEKAVEPDRAAIRAGFFPLEHILNPPPEKCSQAYWRSLGSGLELLFGNSLFIIIAGNGKVESLKGPPGNYFERYGSGPVLSRASGQAYPYEAGIFVMYPFLIFPGRDIEQGDTWNAKVDLPMKVYSGVEVEQSKDIEYTFLGFDKYDGDKVAKIKIKSQGSWTLTEQSILSINSRTSSEGLIYYSLTRRIPVYQFIKMEIDEKSLKSQQTMEYRESKGSAKRELRLLDATHFEKILKDAEDQKLPCKE